jgi:hypothetical protein
MRPRTILGTIDGNRGVNNELTPNQRGKIEGAVAIGASFARAATSSCDIWGSNVTRELLLPTLGVIFEADGYINNDSTNFGVKI